MVAQAEMEAYTDLFNSISAGCFKKCIGKFGDSELQVGEMTCIDRCVGKYFDAQAKVGAVIQEFEKRAQEQMQMQGMPTPPGGRR